MSKVKFGVTKIHCEKTTRGEWARDEIYCAAIPIVGTTQEGTFESDQIDPSTIEGKLMPGKVSTVKNRVKRGTVWKPSMEPVEIDMGEEKALCVLLVNFQSSEITILANIWCATTFVHYSAPFYSFQTTPKGGKYSSRKQDSGKDVFGKWQAHI